VVVLNSLLTAIAVVLLIPGCIFLIECVAALFPTRSPSQRQQSDPLRITVLIPAHNEEDGIQSTIQALLPQLYPRDQVIVVADNCDDQTATIAQAAGAIVLERQDQQRRGKGYALDFGVRFMADNPPDVVVIVDADCFMAPGSLARLADRAVAYQRPVQSVYLLKMPAAASPKIAVSMLAIIVKNWVRFTGLYNLGLPCLLTGTGMAMPWAILEQSPLASGNIVEDMKLGMDLAIAGYSPLFCPDAFATSVLPQKEQAAKKQRTRWEHGHLQTMLTLVPQLLKAAVQQRRVDLLGLGLDLLVPPLSLLVMLWLLGTIAAVVGIRFGASPLPAILLGIEGGLLAIAIFAAWAKYGRQQIPAKTLLTIPLYVLWKIPLYLAFIFKRQTAWVRTDRDKPADATKLHKPID